MKIGTACLHAVAYNAALLTREYAVEQLGPVSRAIFVGSSRDDTDMEIQVVDPIDGAFPKNGRRSSQKHKETPLFLRKERTPTTSHTRTSIIKNIIIGSRIVDMKPDEHLYVMSFFVTSTCTISKFTNFHKYITIITSHYLKTSLKSHFFLLPKNYVTFVKYRNI